METLAGSKPPTTRDQAKPLLVIVGMLVAAVIALGIALALGHRTQTFDATLTRVAVTQGVCVTRDNDPSKELCSTGYFTKGSQAVPGHKVRVQVIHDAVQGVDTYVITDVADLPT